MAGADALAFIDHGPGIANLELAMMDGWTFGNGMGMGLSGAKRLVNDLKSTPSRAKARALRLPAGSKLKIALL